MMQTRNSSPPQPPESEALPLPPEASSTKAQWTEADEIALIDYISEHKAEAGDGMKFKASFWTGVAKEMLSHSTLGGVKTAQGCSGKWDRLKKSYNVVATLKANTSGFNWSDTQGLNITINESCAWNEYIAKNKDAIPYKSKGFPHFHRIQTIMGTRTVRGITAFRPSDQTRGAIANSVLAAPGSSTPIATSREMGPPQRAALNLNNDLPTSSDDDSIPSSTLQPSSILFPAMSKRKHSALADSDTTSVLSHASKRSKSSTSSGAAALHGIKDMMAGISSSIHNGSLGLGQSRPHRKTSAERQIEATTLLQEKEDLTLDQMVAFADLFEQNTSKANTYLALVRADVRRLWVEKQLVDLGYPTVAGGSDA